MKNEVLELVVYKVKGDQLEKFESETLFKLRNIIESFAGFVKYDTFSSVEEDGVFADYVLWENLESARFAAEKIKSLENEEPYASIFGSMEEIKIFQHFKAVA